MLQICPIKMQGTMATEMHVICHQSGVLHVANLGIISAIVQTHRRRRRRIRSAGGIVGVKLQRLRSSMAAVPRRRTLLQLRIL